MSRSLWRLTVRGEFASAHALRHYQGKCESLHGHNYAVEMVVRSPNTTRNATKPGGLYDATAKAFGVTPARVERAIRHAIEVAWLRGDLDVLQRYFGNSVSGQKGKTTNTEFIHTVAYAVRLSLKNQTCYS